MEIYDRMQRHVLVSFSMVPLRIATYIGALTVPPQRDPRGLQPARYR